LILSLPDLFNVGVFLGFMFLLFGILGLQLFMGQAYNRCRLTEMPVNSTYWPLDMEQVRPCNID
jgi:hypothetical protein